MLRVVDIVNIVLFSLIFIVAAHNMLRYIRKIEKSTNKALLTAFYALLLLFSIVVIAGSIFDLVNTGDFIEGVC